MDHLRMVLQEIFARTENLPFKSIIFCLNAVKASIDTVTLGMYPVLARAPQIQTGP